MNEETEEIRTQEQATIDSAVISVLLLPILLSGRSP